MSDERFLAALEAATDQVVVDAGADDLSCVYDKFVLLIELGSDAMLTREDVFEKIIDAATQLVMGDDSGRVVDRNGNTVGHWGFRAVPCRRHTTTGGT